MGDVNESSTYRNANVLWCSSRSIIADSLLRLLIPTKRRDLAAQRQDTKQCCCFPHHFEFGLEGGVEKNVYIEVEVLRNRLCFDIRDRKMKERAVFYIPLSPSS